MTDITAFLAARLDEDEADALAAQKADPTPWEAHESTGKTTDHAWQLGAGLVIDTNEVGLWDCEGSNTLCMAAPTARHVARHDPARVLAEVKAKRRVMERHTAGWRKSGPCLGCNFGPQEDEFTEDVEECPELRDMASVYADHPDYNPAWMVADG